MNSTNIVTVFLTHDGRYLILKRSNRVRTMKNLWAGISGIIEGSEKPEYRARREVLEETGIPEGSLTLLRAAPEMKVESQYANHEWLIHPFLFSVRDPKVVLNWENQDYRWIVPSELSKYETVPSLDRVLACLL